MIGKTYETIGNSDITLKYVGDGWPAVVDWMTENPGETASYFPVPVMFFVSSNGTQYTGMKHGNFVVIDTNNGIEIIQMEESDEN